MKSFFVFIAFVFLTLILFWPVFLGKVNINGQMLVSLNSIFGENIAFKPIGADQLRIYYPSYSFTVAEFKKFKLPLWNPYSFAGQPNVGELQSAVFNPVNIFALVLPFEVFWNFIRLFPSVLAAFFMYLYLKRIKLSGLAAFFGAAAWGFSPFVLTWGEEQVITPYAVVWLPLALFAVEGLKQKKPNLQRLSLGLLAISVAFSLFAGFIQLSLYLLILVVLYAFFTFGFTRKSFLSLVAVFLGIGIAAVQLVPAIELFLDSPRSSVLLGETLYKFLLPIYSVVSYLAPDIFGSPATYNFFRGGAALYYEGILYVGIAVLLFAVFAIFNLKDRLVVFFALLFFVSLLLTIDSPLARAFMRLPLPILSSSIANRILFVPAFSLVVLGSIGYDYWFLQKKANFKKVIVTFFVIYLLLFVLAFLVKTFSTNHKWGDFINVEHSIIAIRNLVIPFVVFLATAALIVFGQYFPKYKKIFAVFIIALAFLHTFYFASKFFSFSDSKFVFLQTAAISYLKSNQGSGRVWSQGDKRIENNFPTYYRLNWPEGYKSLFIKSYGEFAGDMQQLPLPLRSRADVGMGVLKEDNKVIEEQGARRLIDLLGVKYILAGSKDSLHLSKANLTKVFQQDDSLIFENRQAIPRISLVSNYEGPPDIKGMEGQEVYKIEAARRKLIFNKLLDLDFNYKDTVILEKPSPISPQFGLGKISILKDEPMEIVLKTSSKVPKLLYVADNYFPGWKAIVDGNETAIMRANYTFRAVPLAPGEHMVRMYYDPMSFKVGILISVLSLGVLVFFIVKRNRQVM